MDAADLKSRETRVEAQRLSRKRFKITARQAKKHSKLTLRAARQKQAPSVH